MVSCPSCTHRCGVRHAMIVGDRLRYQCPRCVATFDVADVLSAPSLQRSESTPIASFGPPLATGGVVFDDEITAEVARGIQDGDSVYFVVDTISDESLRGGTLRCGEAKTVQPPTSVQDDVVFELTPKPIPAVPESRADIVDAEARSAEADKAIDAVFPSSPELPHVSRYSFIRPGELEAEAPLSADGDDVIEVVPVSDQGDDDAIVVAPMSQALDGDEIDSDEIDSDEIELLPSSRDVADPVSAKAPTEVDGDVTEILSASALEVVSSCSAQLSTARGVKISETIEALAANSREMVESTDVFAVEAYEPASMAVLDMGAEAGSNFLAPPTLRAFIEPYKETAKTPKFTVEESVPPVAKTPVPPAPATTATLPAPVVAPAPAAAPQSNFSLRGAAITGSAMLLAAAATLIAVRGGAGSAQASTSEPFQVAAAQPASPAAIATSAFAASALDVASKGARSDVQSGMSEVRTYASPSLLPPARVTSRVASAARVENASIAASEPVVAEVASAPVAPQEAPVHADVAPSAEGTAAPSLDDAIAHAVVKDNASRKRSLTAAVSAPHSDAPPVRKNAPPPTDAEVVTTNADRAYSSGDLTRASALYREALALSPRFIPARLGAAAVEWDSGDRESAKALYRALVADAPGVVPAIARERAR